MGGYIRFHGGVVRGFGNNNSGVFRHTSPSGYRYEMDVVNVWFKQCIVLDAGVLLVDLGAAGTYNSSGLKDSNIELCTADECESLFMTVKARFDGDPSSATKDGVRAYSRGKIRCNSIGRNGVDQTVFAFYGGRGYQITLNSIRGVSALHSDVFAAYETGPSNSAGQYNTYFCYDYNDIIDSARAHTTDGVNGVDQHETIEGNFILTSNDSDTGYQNARSTCSVVMRG
jgi:hypothetical protein